VSLSLSPSFSLSLSLSFSFSPPSLSLPLYLSLSLFISLSFSISLSLSFSHTHSREHWYSIGIQPYVCLHVEYSMVYPLIRHLCTQSLSPPFPHSLSLTDWLTEEHPRTFCFARAIRKCRHALSIPHSVSQSACMIIILILTIKSKSGTPF
jgi:hypothetical protein